MKRIVLAVSAGLVLGCKAPANTAPVAAPVASGRDAASPDAGVPAGPLSADELMQVKKELATLPPLTRMRASHQTTLVSPGAAAGAPDAPPAEASLALVRYPAGPGALAAYVTKDPGDGKRHPAIVWITGGDNNSIGDVWSPGDPSDDQSAAAYRQAGLVMMFPSQRGGNDNPGRREGFLGEVDDIIAARAHLAGLPYVDPSRIYLGGHSTGATLALLVAESTDRFRAVFSFGPVGHVGAYGGDYVYCDPSDEGEMLVRSPAFWLKDIRTPTFVFEGTDSPGNVDQLRLMRQLNDSSQVTFHEVAGANHFSILAPINAAVASTLRADAGPTPQIAFDPTELARPFK